jgi:hypothetical protein
MKIELGKHIKLITFIVIAIAVQNTACASGIQNSSTDTITVTDDTTRRLVWASSERPDWVDKVPQSDTEFYYVGTSQPFNTAANARDNSREDARNQVLKFYGEFIESQGIESISMSGSTRNTLDAFVVREEEIRSYAENIISQVGTDRYYTEMFINNYNQEEYIVYTGLAPIGYTKLSCYVT